jgi:hypothetical protein
VGWHKTRLCSRYSSSILMRYLRCPPGVRKGIRFPSRSMHFGEVAIARVIPVTSSNRFHRFDVVIRGLTVPALVLTGFILFDVLQGNGNPAVMVDLKSNCKFRWGLYTEIVRNLSREDAGDALVVPSTDSNDRCGPSNSPLTARGSEASTWT